jgi:hypothetical protein
VAFATEHSASRNSAHDKGSPLRRRSAKMAKIKWHNFGQRRFKVEFLNIFLLPNGSSQRLPVATGSCGGRPSVSTKIACSLRSKLRFPWIFLKNSRIPSATKRGGLYWENRKLLRYDTHRFARHLDGAWYRGVDVCDEFPVSTKKNHEHDTKFTLL